MALRRTFGLTQLLLTVALAGLAMALVASLRARPSLPPTGAAGAVLSADGTTLVTTWPDTGQIKLWDLTEARERRTVTAQGLSRPETALLLSADERFLVTMDEAKAEPWHSGPVFYLVWSLATGEELLFVSAPHGGYGAFSPDGALFGTTGQKGHYAQLWDPSKHQQVGELNVMDSPDTACGALSFSPDGNLLAVGSRDDFTGQVKIVSLNSGEVRTLDGDRRHIDSTLFSPDGKLLAVAGRADYTIRLWDTATWEPGPLLRGAHGPMVFSPDGRTFAAAQAMAVKVWDTDSGQELHRLTGHTGMVASIAFLGETLVSVTQDGELKAWNLAIGREKLLARPVPWRAFAAAFALWLIMCIVLWLRRRRRSRRPIVPSQGSSDPSFSEAQTF